MGNPAKRNEPFPKPKEPEKKVLKARRTGGTTSPTGLPGTMVPSAMVPGMGYNPMMMQNMMTGGMGSGMIGSPGIMGMNHIAKTKKDKKKEKKERKKEKKR